MNDYTGKHCLFCGREEKLKILYNQNFRPEELTPAIFSARRTTEHFHYQMARCENCGLLFSKKVLPDEALAAFYSQSKINFDRYIQIITKDYWRHLEPFLKGEPRGSVLEIGCSSGFFLEALAKKGFQKVYGCEPSEEAKQKALPAIRECITTGFFKAGLYDSDSLDLICSFHTLDHMSDPAGALRVCRNILKDQGLLYFITHDAGSLQARIFGERSPIIDIEHIYLFDKKTLRRLFQDSGFEVVDVFDIKNSYPLEYWIKMCPMPPGLRQLLQDFLNWTSIAELRLPIAAGNIGIIAKCLRAS